MHQHGPRATASIRPQSAVSEETSLPQSLCAAMAWDSFLQQLCALRLLFVSSERSLTAQRSDRQWLYTSLGHPTDTLDRTVWPACPETPFRPLYRLDRSNSLLETKDLFVIRR